MKKIFQTIIDKTEGNCIQAAIASLLNKTLDEVPDLKNIESGKSWFGVLYEFLKDCGYEFDGTWYNHKDMNLRSGKDYRRTEFKDLNLPGVDGYFFATVYSPIYHDFTDIKNPQVTHAIIVDKDFNIIHDPNPLNKGMSSYPFHDLIGCNGIINILMISKKIQKYSAIKKEFFGYSLLFYWEDNNGIETMERLENFLSKNSANRKIFQVNDETQANQIIKNKKELKAYV